MTLRQRAMMRCMGRAKAKLRRNLTVAEKLLLVELEKARIPARVQKGFLCPKSFYVLDFFFGGNKFVAVELDGVSHTGSEAYDRERDMFLYDRRDILTLRISNQEVYEDAQGVVRFLKLFFSKLPPPRKELRSLRYKYWQLARSYTRDIHSTRTALSNQ